MSSRLDDFAWRNIPIGPSPEEQARRQTEALRREGDRIEAAVEQGRKQIAAFNAKYGENLGDFARAYFQHYKPGKHAFVHLRMGMVITEEVRPMFAEALAEAISAQPEEARAKWLTEFLTELDRFY